MDLTLYVLGDLHTFVAGLNAIAMLFSPGVGTWTGTGAFGFGSVVGIGLMITLVITMISGIMRQEVRLDVILILLIAYSIMFVPKTSLQIEDLYSGNIGVVDNVPVGVAVPAAIISALTHKIAVNMETAFSTADSKYVAQTTSGFLQPLKVLLSLRRLDGCQGKYACTNILNYTRYCRQDAMNNQMDVKKLTGNPVGVFEGLDTTPVNAMTILANDANPGGTYVTCATAGQAINAETLGWINAPYVPGAENNSSLSNYINSRKAADSRSDAGATQLSSQVFQSISNYLTAASYSNDQIMLNILYGKLMKKGVDASFASDPEAGYQIFMNDAMGQWQADAAGEGSMFVNTMIPAMNILQFLFFALAPLIALVVVASGLKGLSILGSYALFGAWTQTWLPVSAIINFYIQSQFDDVLESLPNVSAMVSANNIDSLYELMATKLAVGSAMLASTPVITLAVMSGSMFALTSVAQRASGAGGAGYINEKEIAPSASQAGLVKQGKSATESAWIAGGGSRQAAAPELNSMATISSSGVLGAMYTASNKKAQQFTVASQAEIGKSISALKDWARQAETGESGSSSTRHLLDSFFGSAHSQARSQTLDKKFGHGAAMTMAAAGALKAQGTAGGDKAAAKLIAGFEVTGKGETKESFEKAFGSQYAERFETNDGTKYSNAQEATRALTGAIKETGGSGTKFADSQAKSDRFTQQASETQEQANSAQRQAQVGGTASFGPNNLVAGVNPDGGSLALGAAQAAGFDLAGRNATTPEGAAALAELKKESDPARQQMLASSMVNEAGSNPGRGAVGAGFLGGMYTAIGPGGGLAMQRNGSPIMDSSLAKSLVGMGGGLAKLSKDGDDTNTAVGDPAGVVRAKTSAIDNGLTTGEERLNKDIARVGGAAQGRIKGVDAKGKELEAQAQNAADNTGAAGEAAERKQSNLIDQKAANNIAKTKPMQALAVASAVTSAVADTGEMVLGDAKNALVAAVALADSGYGDIQEGRGKTALAHAKGAIHDASILDAAGSQLKETGGISDLQNSVLMQTERSGKLSGTGSLEDRLLAARNHQISLGKEYAFESQELIENGREHRNNAASAVSQIPVEAKESSDKSWDSTVKAVEAIGRPTEAAMNLVNPDEGKK